MAPFRQSDPFEQAAEFWNSVRERLIDRYKREPQQADHGIGEYRADTERRRIGEAVYNQGVERTAEVVDGVIGKGLPQLTHLAQFWDEVRVQLIQEFHWQADQADVGISRWRVKNKEERDLDQGQKKRSQEVHDAAVDVNRELRRYLIQTEAHA